MIEYRSFIYLQNQKTGSSFVEEFLTRFCNEPRLHYDKHAALARDAGKFCFVNVREPIDQYKSLFAYGLEGRGQIFDRLSAIGEDGLYARGMDGFDGWMRFVLQAENGPLLDRRYTTDVARIMGFMTWRFLRLASPGLEEAAPAWRTPGQIEEYLAKHNVIRFIIRRENLRGDLKALIAGPLHTAITDHAAANAWIDSAEPVNASQAGAQPAGLSPQVLATAVQREAVLYHSYYQEAWDEFERRFLARSAESQPN